MSEKEMDCETALKAIPSILEGIADLAGKGITEIEEVIKAIEEGLSASLQHYALCERCRKKLEDEAYPCGSQVNMLVMQILNELGKNSG